MKLLVISHTPHYLCNSRIVGWGPTVRELDYLGCVFNQITHLAPLFDIPAPKCTQPYTNNNINFVSIRPTGGNSLLDKLAIIRMTPSYIRDISDYIRKSDAVHIRCPATISLLAIILLAFLRRPKIRWVKYAGNWQQNQLRPLSYTFQRWWLFRGLHRGIVTINGEWPNQPEHVHSFYNPSFTKDELGEARKLVKDKELCNPVKFLFVGLVTKSKGVGRLLQIISKLLNNGINFHLDIIGDGPEKSLFKEQSQHMKLGNFVTFHGWLPQSQLSTYYAQAHFMVFPSSSEGWPKVLSEGMAYGVVPIASDVSSIPGILKKSCAGDFIPADDILGFVNAIMRYILSPNKWKNTSVAGMDFAHYFTYEYYYTNIQHSFYKTWNVKL